MDAAVMSEPALELDAIDEMRLRTWARHNYAPQGERSGAWHPVILDEMRRKDGEQLVHYGDLR